MVVKDAAKNKQAHMRINLDFFLFFSKCIPRMNKKHAIKPETMESAIARLDSIFNSLNQINLNF